MKNKIELYFHCQKCCKELPEDKTPAEYQRLEIGWTAKGIQVWCSRHDCNIVALDFRNQKILVDNDSDEWGSPGKYVSGS